MHNRYPCEPLFGVMILEKSGAWIISRNCSVDLGDILTDTNTVRNIEVMIFSSSTPVKGELHHSGEHFLPSKMSFAVPSPGQYRDWNFSLKANIRLTLVSMHPKCKQIISDLSAPTINISFLRI